MFMIMSRIPNSFSKLNPDGCDGQPLVEIPNGAQAFLSEPISAALCAHRENNKSGTGQREDALSYS